MNLNGASPLKINQGSTAGFKKMHFKPILFSSKLLKLLPN